MSHHKVSVFSVTLVDLGRKNFCFILAIKPLLPHYRISWAYTCVHDLYISTSYFYIEVFIRRRCHISHRQYLQCLYVCNGSVYICSAKQQISSQHWRKFQFIILLLIHLLLKIKLCIVERVLLSVQFKFIIGRLRVNEWL